MPVSNIYKPASSLRGLKEPIKNVASDIKIAKKIIAPDQVTIKTPTFYDDGYVKKDKDGVINEYHRDLEKQNSFIKSFIQNIIISTALTRTTISSIKNINEIINSINKRQNLIKLKNIPSNIVTPNQAFVNKRSLEFIDNNISKIRGNEPMYPNVKKLLTSKTYSGLKNYVKLFSVFSLLTFILTTLTYILIGKSRDTCRKKCSSDNKCFYTCKIQVVTKIEKEIEQFSSRYLSPNSKYLTEDQKNSIREKIQKRRNFILKLKEKYTKKLRKFNF